MEFYFNIGVLFFLSGAVISLIPFRKAKNYIYILPAIGALGLLISGLYLSSGRQITMPAMPISSALEFVFRGDALSGVFVAVVSILTLSVSIYSIGYTKDFGNKGLMGVLYNLFVLSMYAVILSGNIITFLISWETMSVVSYFLVTFDRDKKSAKAAHHHVATRRSLPGCSRVAPTLRCRPGRTSAAAAACRLASDAA